MHLYYFLFFWTIAGLGIINCMFSDWGHGSVYLYISCQHKLAFSKYQTLVVYEINAYTCMRTRHGHRRVGFNSNIGVLVQADCGPGEANENDFDLP